MKRVVAFDPGGSTGIATLTIDRTGVKSYATQTLTEPTDVWNYLATLENLSAVICEQFSSGGAVSRYGFATVKIIGGIHALCYFRGIPLTWHIPAKRMPYVASAVAILHTAGKTKTSATHEATALSHLLAWEAHQP